MKSMAELAWETNQESPLDKCQTIARSLGKRLPRNALYHVPLISENRIKRQLYEMIPGRCLIIRFQKKFRNDAEKNPEQWRTERDTKCSYSVEKFSTDMLESWSTPDPEMEKLFDWPKPNPYVPKDVRIKPRVPNISQSPVVRTPILYN